MAYNLFDNIFDQFTKQAPSQVPNFATPIATRTASYTTPTVTPTKQTTPIKSKEFGVAPGFEGTVDETQSPLFKGVQASADLFTGIQKRLVETAQVDKSRKETETAQKQKEMVTTMLKEGFSVTAIEKAFEKLKTQGQFDYSPGISESIVGGVGERMKSLGETTQNLSQIQNPLERTLAGAIPFAGQTVASVTQPLVSAVEPFVSPVVKAIVEKTGQTQNIQDLSNQWSEFDKTNPILAENIAGLLNVSQIAPIPFAKPIAGAIEQGAKATGKALVKGAEIVAPKVVQGIKNIPNPIPKGSDVSTRANRFIAGDEQKFIDQIRETPGEFATSRGMTEVGEKAIEKAQQNFERSKTEADTSFDAIQGKFNTKGSDNDIVGDLLKANKEKMDAQPRNKDRARVDELLSKYDSGEGLSMSEINEAKRIHARNHKYSYEQRTSNEARNASDIQNDIRDWQFQTAKENGFTNADKVNMETKGWKMFADSLAKKMDRSGANNAIGITDWIALSGGNPTNIALFLGKKAASSNLVKTGAIKLLSKQTKPSIIKGSKADIQQANFEKNVNRGISSDMSSVGGNSMVKPAGLLTAGTGKATGAKNIRVNQKIEKSPVKNEGQVGNRPGTATKLKTNADVQLAKETARKAQVQTLEKELNTNLLSKYNPNKPEYTRKYIDSAITQGKITKEEGVAIVEKLYEKATGFDKPQYEKLLNDLYSNKKIESFDDLLNNKPVNNQKKLTPREDYKQNNPRGMWEEINRKAGDRRYGQDKADALIADFKKKTGWDLMKDGEPKFDKDGNIVKPRK